MKDAIAVGLGGPRWAQWIARRLGVHAVVTVDPFWGDFEGGDEHEWEKRHKADELHIAGLEGALLAVAPWSPALRKRQ
jgi:hypothetical protein